MTDEGLAESDGVEAKAIVVEQLTRALEVIDQHNPARIATLGGECSVSVAPFSVLADRYGDDLAIVWIDSHPDVGTGDSEYPGYHAMAVSALTGNGDPDVQAALPATVSADRVALVGLHWWTDDDYPHVAEWGLQSFGPTSCAARAGRFSSGSPLAAVRGLLSTSMSTPSTVTRSCSASAPNLTA
jgi:arginase